MRTCDSRRNGGQPHSPPKIVFPQSIRLTGLRMSGGGRRRQSNHPLTPARSKRLLDVILDQCAQLSHDLIHDLSGNTGNELSLAYSPIPALKLVGQNYTSNSESFRQ